MLAAGTSEEAIKMIYEITARKGEPGLGRMKRILELLGSPEKDFKVIHVTGTNGKGSTCEFISEILKNSGYSVSVYTSPHLLAYNERFESNNRFISDKEFTSYANAVFGIIGKLVDEGCGLPSQFDILTAIAYLFFKDQNTDFVILEVGLGGRIDSTNTIEKPLASVITEVGIDHTAELGSDISNIAYEKAGIIKEGVPVISGVTLEDAKQVIAEEAVKKNALLTDVSQNDEHLSVLKMKGEHQIRNARVAKAVIEALRKSKALHTNDAIIDLSLSKARKPGRFEVLTRDPVLIIDAAHNSSGIRSALETFDTEYADEIKQDDSLALVTGFMSDKTFSDMIDLISDYFRRYNNLKIIATEPESERALRAERLKKEFSMRGISSVVIEDNQEAYDFALGLKCEYTLCMGSIYLIGNIKKYYNKKGWWKKC